MDQTAIAAMRIEYTRNALNEDEVDRNPMKQFEKWWDEANYAQLHEPNAMTLSTIGEDGMPDARTVLVKGFDERGFVFFTNYNSAKSKQLDTQSGACILFFWKELERQIRIRGRAERISAAESIAYFDSRPEGSKLGAWASPQSMVVAGKGWLKETFDYYAERFKHGQIPKPPHWGGYRVAPETFEFWQGRPNRMHDRILYSKVGNLNGGEWQIERLAP